MLSFFRYIPLSIALCSSLAIAAPDVELVPVKYSYARATRIVDPRETKQVIFYARTQGNISDHFSVRVTAPKGAKVFIRGLRGTRQFSGSLRDFRRSFPVRSETPADTRVRGGQCIEFSPGEIADDEQVNKREVTHPVCDLFPPDSIGALASGLGQRFGGSWSAGETCGYIVDNYLGGAGDCDWENLSPECEELLNELFGGFPPVSEARARKSSRDSFRTLSGTFSRDACGSETEPYIFAVYVDLSRASVDPSDRTTISYWGQSRRRSGGREASIKPVSDGKYAPRPLILMRSLGACGQELNVVQWNAKKPTRIVKSHPYDMLPYHGMILNRSPLGPAELTGGMGTFELSNSYESYGVCFNLVAQRQRANGYPGGEN